ncbi:MAG TPA: hypothetical protein VNA27_07100 [Rubrobacteraceae bacterium]|nr:hypothetical protein [Rubrobacteraceae bacterium]
MIVSVAGALVSLAGAIVSAITFFPAHSLNKQTYEFNQQALQRTTEAQNEAAAVNAMQNHSKLSAEQVQYTVPPDELSEGKYPSLPPEQKSYSWYASHALFTAETIYNLKVGESYVWDEEIKEEMKGNPWVAAARQFVTDHKSYIRWNIENYGAGESSICDQFSSGFVSFIELEAEIEANSGNKCPKDL